MKIQKISFKNKKDPYTVCIGQNILSLLPKEIKKICPKAKKIAIISDKNVPRKFKDILKKN